MSEELYKKYRPQSFAELFGQKEAGAVLKEMFKKDAVPHAILLQGPSGTGKTTIARILRTKLGCGDHDFVEINAASSRGVDTVREIERTMRSAPISGRCRIWLMDECHSLTTDAQNSLLKILEDTPETAYFLLATTDPQKLKTTIKTRCTAITCKSLTQTELKDLVKTISGKEGVTLDQKVIDKISEVSDGSARKALVILHAVIGLSDVEQQLNVVEKEDVAKSGIDIARALMNDKTTWKEMADLIKAVEDDAEAIRWVVMGYAKSVLLNSGSSRAADIIDEFRDNFYDSKMNGLVVACYRIIKG